MSLSAETRLGRILQQVDRDHAVSIRDLSDALGVTRETIRKDLGQLANRNLVRQVRGGVMRIEQAEAPMRERAGLNAQAKRTIGRAAAALIPDGASVILDSGSTTYAAAVELGARQGLTVYTNDLSIALLLRETAHALHLLGGRIGIGEDSTTGHDAIDMLRNYNADFALVGVGGIDDDGIFSDYTRDAAALRAAMIDSAGESFLLGDHSKFGKRAPVTLRNANGARRLITDRAPSKALVQALAGGPELTVTG